MFQDTQEAQDVLIIQLDDNAFALQGNLLTPSEYDASVLWEYTVCVKRNAHLIPDFFVAPLGEEGQRFTWFIMKFT